MTDLPETKDEPIGVETIVLSLRLPKPLDDKILEYCLRNGIPKATVIRQCVIIGFNHLIEDECKILQHEALMLEIENRKLVGEKLLRDKRRDLENK